MSKKKDMHSAADRGIHIIKSCKWPNQLKAAQRYIDNFKHLFEVDPHLIEVPMTPDKILGLELVDILEALLEKQPSYIEAVSKLKFNDLWQRY